MQLWFKNGRLRKREKNTEFGDEKGKKMYTEDNNEKTLSILLVEDDKAACVEIENYIDTCENVQLSGVTNNSDEALEMVIHYIPDAVILDLELHQGGGNGLLFLLGLSRLELPFRPYILITTNNSSEITYESARKLGADFIMAKHESNYSGQYVVEFLRMIHATLISSKKMQAAYSAKYESPDITHRKLTQRICRELDLVGINRKNIGYQYLTDAILITLEKPEANLSGIIAKKYHKSDSSVERAMQNAINRAWRTFPIEELEAHYTAKTHSGRGVPTILEFVFYYTSVIKNGTKK